MSLPGYCTVLCRGRGLKLFSPHPSLHVPAPTPAFYGTFYLLCLVFFFFNILFIYFWFHWVFVDAHGLSRVLANRGYCLVVVRKFLIVVASLVSKHRL